MLVIVLLALVDFGSSYTTEEKCYGDYYEVPLHFTHPMFNLVIYYKQRGGEKKVVYADRQSKDKRISVSYGNIRMKDLTEQDDNGVLDLGIMSSVKLVINDCKDPQSTFYGFSNTWKIPSGAEYIEFSEMSSQSFALKPKVIWNRTDPSIGRGKVEKNHFYLDNLKQKDSGYYKFMGGAGELIEWNRLIVEAYERHFYHDPGETLRMDFSVKFSKVRQILFKPQESDREQRLEKPYMNNRMEFTDSRLAIHDLKSQDSGIYKFVDDEGFLALRLELEVLSPPAPTWVYILVFVIIILCIVCCCCCVKKCCCKKSSNKRSSPATEAAAPPVYYHDTSQSTQPAVPLLEREPRVITSDPPIYNSAGDRNVPTSTQVTLPEGQGPTSSVISTSSNSNPQFEFKGMVFPSAPPLSSDTHIQDVYTSDKLNFL